MTANRDILNVGEITGQQHVDDVRAEVIKLWDGATQFVTGVSGVNTLTGTVSPVLTAYAAGQRFVFRATSDNTDAVTFNIDGAGELDLLEADGTALTSGRIRAGTIYEVVCDGTDLTLVGQPLTVKSLMEVALFKYKKSDGVDGGSTDQNIEADYPFNFEMFNAISGCSLDTGTGVVSVPIGRYIVDAGLVIFNAHSKVRLKNASTGAVISTVFGSQGGTPEEFPHRVFGILDVTSPIDVKVTYDVTTGIGSRGLGNDYPDLTVDEDYGYFMLKKINPFSADFETAEKFGIGTAASAARPLIVKGDETEFSGTASGTGNHVHYQLGQAGGGALRRVVEEVVETDAGGFVDTTHQVPAGARLEGISYKIETAVTGPASITVGTSQDASEFGTGQPLAQGSTFAKGAANPLRTTASSVRLTAVGAGGTFTGGSVRVVMVYDEMKAPD